MPKWLFLSAYHSVNCIINCCLAMAVLKPVLLLFIHNFIVHVVSVLAMRLARKSMSKMTYFMSSGMLNLSSINQSMPAFYPS